jgi:NADPH:quinone reductase-like Zn-dependent oxidoreductase
MAAPESCIPLSDCAGEVVGLGEDCTRFNIGDKESGIFLQGWVAGESLDSYIDTSLGGAINGMLSEYRVFDETGRVALPEQLSYEEGSTLACAAVTAWNALYGLQPLRVGQSVLLLGTGGVSMFALQFAKAAGARGIVTSSSDEKLERVRALGADHTINYKEVRRLTDGRGVDVVVETGGPGMLQASIASTRRGGAIQMIGVFALAQIDPLPIFTSGVIVRGVMVGSGEMFAAMNPMISYHKLRPVIDKVFGFEDAAAAYSYLQSANHVGKVVVAVG